MKKTLAFLIAVLMVVAMLPAAVLSAAGEVISEALENVSGGTEPEPTPGTTPTPEPEPVPEPAPADTDYFSVYDAEGKLVDHFATLAEADAALQNGYTLKILKSVELDEAYTWGASRLAAKTGGKLEAISYTIDGGNAGLDLTDPDAEPILVTGAWIFGVASCNDSITLKNVALGNTEQGATALTIALDGEYSNIGVTIEDSIIVADGDAISVQGYATSVKIVGDNTVVLSNAGAAVAFAGTEKYAGLYIGGGNFMSNKGAATIAVTGTAKVFVGGGNITNNKNSALDLGDGVEAYVTGGNLTVTGTVYTETAGIAPIRMGAATLLMAGGVLNAPANAAGAPVTEGEPTPVTDGIWSIYASSAAAVIELYSVTANYGIAGRFVNDVATPATLPYSTVGAEAGTAGVYSTAVTVNADLTGAEVVIMKGTTVVAASDADNDSGATGRTVLEKMSRLTPDGGVYKLQMDYTKSAVGMFTGMPMMNVTLDGGNHTIERPCTSSGHTCYSPSSAAHVTLTNVKIGANAKGRALYLNPDYNRQGSVTLANGAIVHNAGNNPVEVLYGAKLYVKEGAVIDATTTTASNAILVQGGYFYLQGGTIKVPATNGFYNFLPKTQGRVFTVTSGDDSASLTFSKILGNIVLESGTVWTVAGPQYLLMTTDAALVPNVEIASGVKFLAAVNPDDTVGVSVADDPIEILDDKGAHVAYYDSLKDAKAALKDGYTLKLRGNHIETKSALFTISDIDWTLDASDGNGGRYKLYIPYISDHDNGSEDFPRGLQFNGSNTNVYINDLIVYAAELGLCAWSATAGVIANNVFVYANGAIGPDSTAYFGNGSAAIRLAGGGSITMVGEKSGAYGVGTTYLIRANGSTLNIYGGTYTNAGAGVTIQAETGSSLFVAGGTFIAEETATTMIWGYGATTPYVTVAGGEFIHRGTGKLFSCGANGNQGIFLWVYGGQFYTKGSTVFGHGSNATTGIFEFVNLMGGEFYSVQTDENATGIPTRKTGATISSKVSASVGVSNLPAGFHIDYFGENYEMSAVTAYTVAAGDAAADYYAVGQTFNKVTYTLKSNVTDTVAYKVYTNTEDPNAPVLNFYGAGSLFDALSAVGGYNTKFELQGDVNVKEIVAFTSRRMNQGSKILFTSAAGAPNGYYTIDFNGTGYKWLVNGGYWLFENVAVIDSTAKHFHTLGMNTTIELGDGAIFAAYDVPLLISSSYLIVGENAYVYKLTNASGVSSGNAPIRMQGTAVVDIYGKIGFNTEDQLVMGMASGAIGIETAGSSSVLNIHDGAWIGSSATTDLAKPLIGDNRTYDGTHYNNSVNIYDGAVLQSNFSYVDLAGAKLFIGDVEFYSTNTVGERVMPNIGSANYALYLEGVEATLTNMSINLTGAGGATAQGHAIYMVDHKYTGTDRLDCVFTNVNVVGGGNPLLALYTTTFNLTMDGGSYEIKTGGQLMTAQASSAYTAGGCTWTLKGGVRLIKDDATQGMINIYGKQDIVIEDAYIYAGKSTMLSFQSGFDGKVTIKNGTFTRDSILGSLISIPDGAKADVVIEDGNFIWGSRAISTNNGYDSTFMSIASANANVTIKNGNFLLNMDNDAGVKKATLFYRGIQITAGNVVVENGNFEIIAKQASTESLEQMSLFRVAGTGTLTVKDGNFKGIGNFLALFEQAEGGKLTIETGTFEATDGYLLYSDSYTGAAGTYGIVVEGGTFTMQSAANSVNSSDADAIIGVNTGSILVKTGLFVNNSVNSGHVINKFGAAGSVRLDGGMYFACAAQKSFYTSAGNSGSAVSVPVTSVPIVAGKTARIDYMGREYYVFVYKLGNLLAPEVDSIKVRLYEDAETTKEVNGETVDLIDNGLLFVSTIPEITYAAFQIQLDNMMADMNADSTTVTGYNLEFATLIAPFQNLVTTGGVFTKEAFEAAELPHVLIQAEKGISINDDGDLEIRAALIDIAPENYGTFYTAQPYVKITFMNGDTAVSTETWYPTFTTNTGVASLSNVAQSAILDTFAYPVGEYLYKSITQKGAYSRYSAEQQALFLSFIAHTHEFDFNGQCKTCDANICTEIEVDQSVLFLGELGRVNYFSVELTAGISYKPTFAANGVATAVMYDADGNVCDTKNGFECPADGTYYVVVTGLDLASTEFAVEHVHVTDYKGFCSICEQDLANTLEVEKKFEQLVTVGDKLFFKADLIAGKFTTTAINGTYAIYDANGAAVAIENNIFESIGGTYYFVVDATFSAKMSVYLEHVHNYGHTGVCAYPTCNSVVTINIDTIYKAVGGKMANGDTMYLKFTVPAGEGDKVYSVRMNMDFIGLYTMYDAEGNRLTNYTLTAGADYYVVVTAQAETEATVTITVAHTHGADEYNFRGEGVFTFNGEQIHCSEHNVCKGFGLDSTYTVQPVEGQTTYWFKVQVPANKHYEFSFSENVVSANLYGEGNTPAEATFSIYPGAGTYYDPADGIYYGDEARWVYVVVTVAADNVAPISITTKHVHFFSYAGVCADCGTNLLQDKFKNGTYDITYIEGQLSYYRVGLAKDEAFYLGFEGAEVTWELLDRDGNKVFDSSMGDVYTVPATAPYFLHVTALTATETGAKMIMSAHVTHTPDYTGACTVAGCTFDLGEEWDSLFAEESVELDELEAEDLGLKAYGSFVTEAGFTYSIVGETGLTLEFYDAEGNAIVLTEGAFACTEAGTCYVILTIVEIPADAALTLTFAKTATPVAGE